MKLDVRKTTPLTQEDYESVQAFAAPGTAEHEALVRVSPVPLRDGSEGSTLRALALLGMTYVRERSDAEAHLLEEYELLAAERNGRSPSPLRRNMARRARAASQS